MFKGSLVALVTPMHENGDIDWNALFRLIDWHLEQETDGLVILGSTGESATITADERSVIIKKVVDRVQGRLPVIAGTGSYSTQKTIELTREAATLGVDACLIVTPYYNKPTQQGLIQHYTAVANAVAIPQILYNVPSRTAVDLSPETAAQLSSHAHIVGLKEATGDLARLPQLISQCQSDFTLYSGDDATALEFMLAGGKGVISVIANLVPKLMHTLCAFALRGDRKAAETIDRQLGPLCRQLSVETNPIPSKWALSEWGLIEPGIRLPLTPLSTEHQPSLRQALEAVKIQID